MPDLSQPFQDPLQRPPLSSEEIVAQINNLHPDAKAAALGASKIIAANQPSAGAPPAEATPPGQNMGFAPPTSPVRPIGGPKIPQGLGMPSPESEEHLGEFNRLTAPPLSRGDPLAHTAADTGLPGTGQIHNKFGRTLAQIADAVGGGLFPGIAMGIPGTQLHHNMLVNQARGNVNEDIAGRNAQARQDLEEAQAEHAASAAKPEQGKTATTGEGVMQYHPETDSWTRIGAAPTKEEPEGRTVNTDQGVMQWDPATKSYSIRVGGVPEKEQTQKIEQDESGVYHVIKDGKATPVTVNGQPFKGKETKQGDDFAQFYKRYLSEHNLQDTATNEAKAKRIWEPPQKPPQMLMVPPEGPAFTLRPGVTPPAGSMGATPFGNLNAPTMQMKNVAAQAELVHEQTPAMLQELDRLKGKLGPMQGRWNEFMQGKVGMNDPDFAGLRADLLMYSSAVALMHARGRLPENLREEFDRTINNPGQDFGNLKAVIQHIDQWTVKNMQAMGGAAPSAGGTPPEIKTQAEFDKLPKGAEYMEDGKRYRKP